jgi:hypothetical protein
VLQQKIHTKVIQYFFKVNDTHQSNTLYVQNAAPSMRLVARATKKEHSMKQADAMT